MTWLWYLPGGWTIAIAAVVALNHRIHSRARRDAADMDALIEAVSEPRQEDRT